MRSAHQLRHLESYLLDPYRYLQKYLYRQFNSTKADDDSNVALEPREDHVPCVFRRRSEPVDKFGDLISQKSNPR